MTPIKNFDPIEQVQIPKSVEIVFRPPADEPSQNIQLYDSDEFRCDLVDHFHKARNKAIVNHSPAAQE